MTLDWWFSFIPAVLLLGWAWFSSHIFRSWLAPSAFWSGYWALALILPLILAADADYWPGASWAILLLSLFFSLGTNLCGVISVHNSRIGSQKTKSSTTWAMFWGKQVLWGCILVGFASSAILIFRAGYSLSILLRPQLLFQVGLSYASRRYAYGESIPIVILLNTFMYLGGFVGGTWFGIQRSWRKRILGGLGLLPGLLQAILVNARTGMIWLLIFFIASYASVLVLVKHHRRLITPKRILLIATCAGLLIGFYFSLQLIREAESVQSAPTSAAKTWVSVISPPYVFSYWFRENWDHMQPSWGTKTFNGFFSLLGFSDAQALGWEPSSFLGYTPNVYSALRQLIEDFTFPGSLFVLLLTGMIVGTAYHRVIRGNVSWLPILALYYAVVLGSYLANWLNYTSLFVAWLMFVCISYLLPLRRTDLVIGSV